MEENQTNQNLNQQPVQPVQPQPEQVQQPVQQQPTEQPSASMQIQQLLVQQQQYQKQYNELVDYVKKTPNLPIEQVNQIKAQLDQLNALFVEGKQKLQALGYTQVQVNKPTEVKKGAKNNFSFKKLAIGCGVVLFLIFVGFFVTLTSLIRNPDALLGIGVGAGMAKTLLQAFSALLFGSIIILMIGVIITNIYRLITVKNQSKKRYIWGLIGGIVGAAVIGALMGLVFSWINKIVVEKSVVNLPIVQPYLVGVVENQGKDEYKFPYDDEEMVGKKYPLIAPAEFAFRLRSDRLLDYQYKNLGQDSTIKSVRLLCGNGQGDNGQVLELSDISDIKNYSMVSFNGTCLYGEKGTYYYSLEINYVNNVNNENLTKIVSNKDSGKPLTFDSEINISLVTSSSSSSNNKTTRVLPTNGEFNLGKSPAKMSVDTTQVFIDFGKSFYNVTADLDGDGVVDRENQVKFDYSFKVPQVYHSYFKFPDVSDFLYSFPVRVIPSDLPVCGVNVEKVENFEGKTRYKISTEFVDEADAMKISTYQYTIKNTSTNKVHEVLKDGSKEFNYTFPEKGNYKVVLDYTTLDGNQGWCESDVIQLQKETFDVKYTIMMEDKDLSKFKELCSSKGTDYSGCRSIFIDMPPQKFQLKIDSISPKSNTLKKSVYFNDKTVLDDDDTYSFSIPDEGEYILKIVTSDTSRGMDEETIEIKFTVQKPEILGNVTITSKDTKLPVSEGFEPLSVILDASKTEINIPGDEIVFFTWDFGDGEVKEHLQNGVVAHTYNYDYDKENGIFQPTVTIRTLQQRTQVITGPILNVKKGLIDIDITSISHPARQAQVDKEVTFEASFDGMPEKMIWDFGDGTAPFTCNGRECTKISHTFTEKGVFSIKVSLEFDVVQQVDKTMDFKVY